MIHIYYTDGTSDRIGGELCALDSYESVFVILEANKHTYISKRSVTKIEEFVDESI